MHKIYKTLETLKSHDMDPSTIDKIEEIIDTLGTTFSSIKTKKVETPAKKEPKSVYVPTVPKPKINITFSWIGLEIELQLVLLPLLLSLEVFSLGLYLKALLRLVVQLKSFFMILMMVQSIQLDLFASCLAQRHKRKRLSGGNPICFSF